MGKKKYSTSEDIFSKLANQAPLETLDYKTVDNYYFTDSYKDKVFNIQQDAVKDLEETGFYYDENNKPIKINNLDNASWFSKIMGDDTSNKLLKISTDILYPDGEYQSEKLYKEAIANGLDPEFAKEASKIQAANDAKSASERNGSLFDVLEAIGMGTLANSISSSIIKEQRLIPFFDKKQNKWVSKVATQKDFDAGASTISAYGPRLESDNIASSFVKSFNNALGSLPKNIANFYAGASDLFEASANYLTTGNFQSDYNYTNKLADKLTLGYDNAKKELSESSNNFLSLEGLSAGIGSGLGSVASYAALGNVSTLFGSVPALSKVGMINAGMILNGGEAYDQAIQNGLSREDAALMALATGAVNTAIELKVGSNKLQEWLVGGKAAKEIPRIILEETGGDVSKLNKATKNIFSKALKSFDDFTKIPIVGTALEEGSEEFMQSLVGSTARAIYNTANASNNEKTYGKGLFEPKNMSEIFQDAFKEAAIGALVGGLTGAVAKNDTNEKDNIMPFIVSGDTDLIYSSLQELKDKNYITEESFNNYSERVDKLNSIWNSNKTIFEGIAKNNKVNSDAVKSHVLGLIDEEFELKDSKIKITQNIAEIQADSSLSDAVKQEKVKQFQQEINDVDLKLSNISKQINDFIPDDNGNIRFESKQKAYNNVKEFILDNASKILDISNDEIDLLLNSTNLSEELQKIIENTTDNNGIITSEDRENLRNITGLNNKDQFIDNVLAIRKINDDQIKKIKEAEEKAAAEAKEKEDKKIKNNQKKTKEKVEAAQIKKNEVAEENIEENIDTTVEETIPNTEIPLPTINDDLGIPNDQIPNVNIYDDSFDQTISSEKTNETNNKITNEEVAVANIVTIEETLEKAKEESKDNGLVKNHSEVEKIKKDLLFSDLTLKREVGNSIISLNVDYVELILGNTTNKTNEKNIYDQYDEEGNIQINKSFDSRLQDPKQFNKETVVNIILPTYEQIKEKGIEGNYTIADYKSSLDNIEEFPIAFVDSNNNIIGYLPTTTNVRNRVDESVVDAEVIKNQNLREFIFNNKDANISFKITNKSSGVPIFNKKSKSIYNALGNGKSLSEGVEIAVVKNNKPMIALGEVSRKLLKNSDKLENGVVYSITPTADGSSYHIIPMNVQTIGKSNAKTILKLIQLYKANNSNPELLEERNDLSNEIDLKNFNELSDALNNITYIDNNNDKHLIKLGKKLHLGLSQDLSFEWNDVMSNETIQNKIIDILSKRYFSVSLNNFKNSYLQLKVNNNNKIEKIEHNDYLDYLNKESVITTNLQGQKISNSDNLYFTAQSVIEISSPMIQPKQIESKEIITYPSEVGDIVYTKDKNGELELQSGNNIEQVEEVVKPINSMGVQLRGKKPKIKKDVDFILTNETKSLNDQANDLMNKCKQ